MVSFIYYDIAFLVLFCTFLAIFLYRNRKKVIVESKIILLYKTKMGLDTINYVGKKHPKLLSFLSRFVVIAGYIMMLSALVFFVGSMILILTAAALPKIPPVIPLVPYVDKLLPPGILPPFYFTYWIIVIAVVAIAHEFSHGIFAKMKGIRIKSTGFGFLGPLLAAFVEIDEKQMAKKPIKDQLAVLAAGPSANLALWIIFFLITGIFFSLSFVPNGVIFSSYMIQGVNASEISMIDGNPANLGSRGDFTNAFEKINKSDVEVRASNETYFASAGLVAQQELLAKTFGLNPNIAILYEDTPAYHANLSGAIQEITFVDENRTYATKDMGSLQKVLNSTSAGQNLLIRTTRGNYSVTLAQNPNNSSLGLLGIGFFKIQNNFIAKAASLFRYKDPFISYAPKGDGGNGGEFIIFIYHLLYWLMIINFFIMLFNMLPVGIVDGGRFFYLSALALTGSPKKAGWIFKMMTYAILLMFFAIMASWVLKAF